MPLEKRTHYIRCFLPSFKSTGLSSQKQRPWRLSWISDRNGFSYLRSTSKSHPDASISHPMQPTKKQVIWPFDSGEVAQNRFSRWWQRWPSWISDQNDFSYCWPSLKSIGLSVYLGFQIGMILATFDLQVTLMLSTKFGINWTLRSGEEVKNRFSRWSQLRPFLISVRNEISFFFHLQVTPMLPSKFQVNWPFYSGDEAKNRFSRSWISEQNNFTTLAIFIYKSPRCFLTLIFKMADILDFRS